MRPATETTADITLHWFKSSYSGGANTECVEVAVADGMLVRDSKDPFGPALVFPTPDWTAFIGSLKD